jgi:hypothetical protein
MGAFSTQKASMHLHNGTCDNQDSNKRNAPYFGLAYPLQIYKNMSYVFRFEYKCGKCFYSVMHVEIKYGKRQL